MPLNKPTVLPVDLRSEPDNLNSKYTGEQIKDLLMKNPEHLKKFIEELIDKLNSTTDGASGADNIGATALNGITGATVQTILEALKAHVDLNDETLQDNIDTLENALNSNLGASFVGGSVAGLTGTTVQALLTALKSYIDTHKNSADHDGRYYTETESNNKFVSKDELTNQRKLSATGDFTGTLNGLRITQVEPALSSFVESLSDKLDGLAGAGRTTETVKGNADALSTHLAETVNVKYFGAIGDGVADDTTAIGNAIDMAILKRKKLYFPSGVYCVNACIDKNLNSVDFTIVGESRGEGTRNTKILWRGGAGTLFKFTNVRNLRLKTIEISGCDLEQDDSVLTVGSIGIDTDGSINAINCVLEGFDKIVNWRGGYYHRFINCTIRYTKNGLYNFNANNIVLDNCKVLDVEQLLSVVAGSGAVTIINSSLEKWTGILLLGSAGSDVTLNVSNTYVENYPYLTPPNGIEGTYSDTRFCFGFGAVNLLGNNLFTSGISRFVYGSTVLKHVVSLGNRIQIGIDGVGDLSYYIYNVGSIETVLANDIAVKTLTQTDTNTPTYISSYTSLKIAPGASFIYDAFNKKIININAGKTTSRPTTGLTNGYSYFDTDLALPIWWNGLNWVDATGTTV